MARRPTIPVLIGPFSGPTHGVSVINRQLASRLRGKGSPVRCLDLSPGHRPRGPAYHAVRAARTGRAFLRILLAPFHGRHRYVMSLDGGGGLLYNLVLMLALRLTGQTVALYHHNSRYVMADSRLIRAVLRLANAATLQVFCSQAMAAQFADRYGVRGRVLIVSNVAWVAKDGPGPGSGHGARMGYLSALTAEKGLGRALETFRAARKAGLAAELWVAGSGASAAMQAVLDQVQAEFGPALRLAGPLSGAEKTAFYAALDVFLFPSLYHHETQSLVVPEALAAGTPVVTFDHHFVAELAHGLVVPPTADFAAAAVRYLATGQEPAVRQARRAEARSRFEDAFAPAAAQAERLLAWAQGGDDR
jgi:glycosyltransferase involved in cell wall biosynthesis